MKDAVSQQFPCLFSFFPLWYAELDSCKTHCRRLQSLSLQSLSKLNAIFKFFVLTEREREREREKSEKEREREREREREKEKRKEERERERERERVGREWRTWASHCTSTGHDYLANPTPRTAKDVGRSDSSVSRLKKIYLQTTRHCNE